MKSIWGSLPSSVEIEEIVLVTSKKGYGRNCKDGKVKQLVQWRKNY